MLIRITFLIISFGIIRNYATNSAYLKTNRYVSNPFTQDPGRIWVENVRSICKFLYFIILTVSD